MSLNVFAQQGRALPQCPGFHGGTEAMEDTECERRQGQAPGSVVSLLGDFISFFFFVNSLSNFTCVLCSAVEQ